MERDKLATKILCLILGMSFALTGCLPSDIPRAEVINAKTIPGTTTGGSTGAPTLPPTVEIRHLIEPNLSADPTYSSGTGYGGPGSYVRKLTLPKNFAGRLYVAGINIGTLMDRHVKVRFKFGMNNESVTIGDAIIAEAPGITPSTGISVLVLDLRGEPFRNIRLPYDLYDYNEYTSAGSPTQSNLNSGLYCRGLKVEDDPTFVGTNACDSAGEECLYSYAKVLDQGLVKSNGVTSELTLPQAKSVVGSNYFEDFPVQQLKKPLSDKILLPYRFSDANASTQSTSVYMGTSLGYQIAGGTYYYRGPYQLRNQSEWQFQASDLTIPKGLFRSSISTTAGTLYYGSNMFPLATKLSLGANVAHLSSATWNGTRSETVLSIAGPTEWMDGSNARVQSRNAQLEHVGSCNVTASIELIAKDNNNNEYVIALSNDVKLQLVRPTQIITDTGDEVLSSNFKTCSSNASCGGSQCCFNSRCWDSSLVSQCFSSTTTQGNLNVGSSCTTDLQCSSLCCNSTTGTCAPHNTSLSPAVLCSKPIGNFCISREWCQKAPITRWLIVRTGTDQVGNITCNQVPITANEFGDCMNGVCIAPVQGIQPAFNPTAPGACANAVPPPSF